MAKRLKYVCPRCGTVHSTEDYKESLFCEKCGSFLRRKYVVVKQSLRHIQKKDKAGFERFFPYTSSRPFQRDAIDFAFDAINNRKIGLLSSPCGTGKSISVLTAFFMAKELDSSVGRLLALTRTRNQLEIYCRELERIKEYSGVNFVASIFKGKKEMCPHVRKSPKIKGISYRDFLQYCRNLKDGTFGKTCEYYERTYKGRKVSFRAHHMINKIKKFSPLLPDEVYKISTDEGFCPYEVTRILAKYADIIVGNYNYVLVDSVRESTFEKAGMKFEDVNCIFDEAHSLPYYAAGILSDELSLISVRRAQHEVETFGIDDSGVLEALHDVMVKLGRKVYEEFGADVQHVIETHEIVRPLLSKLRVNRDKLLEIISELSELGDIVRYKRAERGRNPISYLSRCATFFEDWISMAGSSYARYSKVEGDRSRRQRIGLGIRCLDPALAASIINQLRSAILMSGTLWHTDYYIDVLGIERRRCKSIELPSPFPRENRLIVVDTSVTTKFERRNEAQWKRIANHLERIIEEINGKVAVYFPSYAIMHEVAKAMDLNLPIITERRDTRIADVLQFLKLHEHCIVFGVARAKISEGVDMSLNGKSMLSAVITVGLPYPKQTELQKVLIKYFEEKFGNKSLEYAIGIPCLNALAQSTGRLLRSPDDKGIIVMMDERAAGWFRQKFPNQWKEDMKAHHKIETLIERIRNFNVNNTQSS